MTPLSQYKTIQEIKDALRYQPKEDKVAALKQEIINRGLSTIAKPMENGIISNFNLEKLVSEIESNHEAYESATERKELIPFIYDRDLDWFFNVKNVGNIDSYMLPVYEFLESQKDCAISTIDFLNLLFCQIDFLKTNIEKPFFILAHLKTIPIAERELHLLYGMMLKSFGGYPVRNLDHQYSTTLALLEKPFMEFTENTPEKVFCQINWVNYYMELGEKRNRNNAYFEKQSESFPHHEKIVSIANDKNKPTKERWEYILGLKCQLENDVALQYELGMEYSQRLLGFLKEMEDLLVRLYVGETAVIEKKVETNVDTEIDHKTPINDLTNGQLVLLFYYFFSANNLEIRSDISIAPIAKFIHLILGKEFKNASSSDIYKKLQKAPNFKTDKEIIKDLEIVKDLFSKADLKNISEYVENEIVRSKRESNNK